MSAVRSLFEPPPDAAPAGDATPCPAPRIGIGIATRGRPAAVAAIVDHLRFQTVAPAAIVVACTAPGDVPDFGERPDVTVLQTRAGLARQRNAILAQLEPQTDIIVFFDDDFLPEPGWLAAAAAAMDRHADVGCLTGAVLADGIKGPGLSLAEARTILAGAPPADPDRIEDGYSPYGCNMALRCAAIRGLRFDERLVLYGWLEDRDFGGGLARAGWRLLWIGGARGVHLGVKTGRVAGRRLGYSQMVNPIHLLRKGTMTRRAAANHMARNFAANLAGSIRPEPYIDRRGRLAGNALGLLDLCRGRITPERAEQL